MIARRSALMSRWRRSVSLHIKGGKMDTNTKIDWDTLPDVTDLLELIE